MVWPAAPPDRMLHTAVLDAASRRNGLKEPLTECETEIFLSLARGHRIAAIDHETGALWRGWVDMTFPEHGFVWVITDVGERKLLDIGVHTVWRPDQSGACGSVRREAGHLKDDRALTTDIGPNHESSCKASRKPVDERPEAQQPRG